MAASHDDTSAARERRAAERLMILGDLQGEVMVFQPMVIRDVSAIGAQIETTVPLQIESLHDIRLSLGDLAIVLKGRVVHCSIADIDQEMVRYRSGIEFVDAPERVQAVIERFVREVKSGRRSPRHLT